MTQIECKDLIIGYENKIVKKDLNFRIDEGDYLCVVGENGAGKSTLIKTLLGLIPPLDGTMTREATVKKSQIGYLPQQTVVQRDFPASVWEIVLSGCLAQTGIRPFYNAKEKSLARENMKRMGIEHLKKKCYRELSGGQQQRVLLARALCATQKILLLDEPVSGLDPKVSNELYDLIKELNDSGITIIMISHDVAVATKYAKTILHLGKTTFFGTTDEYVHNEVISASFLRGNTE